MNRKEFIEQLEQLLMDIPPEERIEALAYYNGYFEDAGVENEEKIIRELESPEKVAKIIKADIGGEEEKEYTESGYEDTRFHQQEEVGQYNTNQQSTAGKKEDKASKIILIVLLAIVTSPLWLTVAGSIAGLIVGALGTIFGVAVAFVAVVFALYVAGLVLFGVGAGLLFTGGFAAGIGLIGAALLVLAPAILGTIGCVWMFGKFCPWFVKSIVGLCSRLIHRKERTV